MIDQPDIKARFLEMTLIALCCGLVFLLVNFIHFQVLTVNVILYACIWDMLIAIGLVIGFYWLVWRQRSRLLPTELVATLVASAAAILLYAVMGPTVIDRSLSIYIVNKIDQRGGQVAEAAMPDIFIQEYMPEFRLVDVRMTEQVTSGTVRIEDGCIILTARGRRLSRFTNWYRKTFLPQKRNLMGEVTNQLTDPFKTATAIVETDCNKSRAN